MQTDNTPQASHQEYRTTKRDTCEKSREPLRLNPPSLICAASNCKVPQKIMQNQPSTTQ